MPLKGKCWVDHWANSCRQVCSNAWLKCLKRSSWLKTTLITNRPPVSEWVSESPIGAILRMRSLEEVRRTECFWRAETRPIGPKLSSLSCSMDEEKEKELFNHCQFGRLRSRERQFVDKCMELDEILFLDSLFWFDARQKGDWRCVDRRWWSPIINVETKWEWSLCIVLAICVWSANSQLFGILAGIIVL